MDAITSEAYHQQFILTESHACDIIRGFINKEGVNLWPVLKRKYFADHHIFSKEVPKYAPPLQSRELSRTIRGISPTVRKALNSIPKKQALIFTRKAVHVRKLGGKLYDPYLDPIIPNIQEAGLLPIKMVLETTSMQECHYPPLELPILKQTVPAPPEAYSDIAMFEEYTNISRHHRVPVVPQSTIQMEWLNILSHSELFQSVLNILQPRLVIHEEYYNPTAMGLAHACRKMGIACAEYQHGMQCNHIMYMFQHVPPDGFETVPQWFITWGEQPAHELITRFSSQNFHKVCIGGKPENIAWVRGDYEEEKADCESLREFIGGRKSILIPLALSVENALLDALRTTILTSPKEWVWLLRNHPIFPSQELEFKSESPAIESKLSSSLSLNSVLRMTDHVVSGISTVCLDAMYAHGIPITILGDNAAYYYKDCLNLNMTTYASTAESIYRSIATSRKSAHPETITNAYISNDTSLLTPTLRHIAKQDDRSH